MELPEHTCISCVYLYQSDKGIIPAANREWALSENTGNADVINYELLVCYKGNRNYSIVDTGNMVTDVRDSIVTSNSCKDWMIFQEVSPHYVEQNLEQNIEQVRSINLTETLIKLLKISLAISFIGMVITFIITLITWYLF